MTTNDEPLSAYRPAYVAGLERRVEEQREAVERALAVIEKVEWIGSNPYCPWCYGTEFQYRNEPGHASDCPRQAALAGLRRVAGQ